MSVFFYNFSDAFKMIEKGLDFFVEKRIMSRISHRNLAWQSVYVWLNDYIFNLFPSKSLIPAFGCRVKSEEYRKEKERERDHKSIDQYTYAVHARTHARMHQHIESEGEK